jgi:hypothetical protein
MGLSKSVIIGYITSLAGTALWLYGYFEAGHPTLIDWHTYTPWWIADFLPNMESEIGMALALVSTVPIRWRSRRESASDASGTSMVSEG